VGWSLGRHHGTHWQKVKWGDEQWEIRVNRQWLTSDFFWATQASCYWWSRSLWNSCNRS
jgi:hypothetical protein